MATTNPATAEAVALYITGTLCKYATLHSADPGTTGANEITAAGRQLVTWTGGAVDGNVSGANVSFSLAVSTAAPYVGYWSASTAGTFYEKALVSIPSGSARTVTVTPSVAVS